MTAELTAKDLIARASLDIEVVGYDGYDEEWTGRAYYLTSGEWVMPDSGPSFWEGDVELIGCVMTMDTVQRVFTADEAVLTFGDSTDTWSRKALEQHEGYTGY